MKKLYVPTFANSFSMVFHRAAVAFLALVLLGQVARGQVGQMHLITSESLGTMDKGSIALLSPLPANFDVEFYKISYHTVDANGDSTIATGALAIPLSDSCNSFPMAAYCHGTVLENYNIPSEQNEESGLVTSLASAGYVTVAPDYLGLGDNDGMHPYLHAQTEATATIDAIRAAREFLPSVEYYPNVELFLTGYSQGGHAAMATARHIQTFNLEEELNLSGVAPMSGAYNLSGSQTDIILDDAVYSSPGYILYLLQSYQMIYGNLYTDLSDIVQEPYATDMAPYFDGDQDEYSMIFVNNQLPNMLSELLVDTFITNLGQNDNHPLRVDLADNDVYDWAPDMPLRMFYCGGDMQVDPANALTAESTMNANGATDVEAVEVSPDATHTTCIEPAIMAAYDFFETLSEGCSFITGIDEANSSQRIRLYPNPTSGKLTVDWDRPSGQLSLYSTDGRLVHESPLQPGRTEVDVSNLRPGAYLTVIRDETSAMREIVVISE